jgi:phosphocarrier protein HPr
VIAYKLKVINNLGLHVRVCSKLVACAGRYSANITFTFNDHTVDAKSIIGLMSLGAGLGSELELKVDGEDELQAAEAIKTLFANGFGELN